MGYKYKFDFSKLTAMDAVLLGSGDFQKMAAVIDKAIVGGLSSYGPAELQPIAEEFQKLYTINYLSPMASLINGLKSLADKE